MGLILNKSVGGHITPRIVYQVKKCKNSTENVNSCASPLEISTMMKYIEIQTAIPKSMFFFQNYEQPRKRTFEYRKYHLDEELMKRLTGYLSPVILQTDHGIFNEDFLIDSVDFNVDNLQSEVIMNKNDTEGVLFYYDLYFGLYQETYYRSYDKLGGLVASFGGIMNILYIIGKIICFNYNSLVLKHKLVNISFENLEASSMKYRV